MFQRLQERWGVNTREFWIIFIAFGLTGTTTAFLTRFITAWLGMDETSFWLWKVLLRVGMLVLGYQFILLGYGALLGQWAFFWKYEKKLLTKLGILRKESGVGSLESGKRSRESGVGSLESGVASKGKLYIEEGVVQALKVKSEKLDGNLEMALELHDESQPQTTNPKPQTHLALFASGTGSNAEKIIEHLRNNSFISVALIVCNNPKAGVLTIAATNGIPALIIEKERFFRGDGYLPELASYQIDFIVLAGFLWKIPDELIVAFPKKIINIHPALLPKFGGKGMYGMKVHQSVIAAGEKESGISIHYVNEQFDEGEIIMQAACDVADNETPETLANKIHLLEHVHFPLQIEKWIMHNK